MTDTPAGPATVAGRALLAFWTMHRRQAHGVTDQNDAIPDDILAIEAEAAETALRSAAERVRTLNDSDPVVILGADAMQAAVLAILEPDDA